MQQNVFPQSIFYYLCHDVTCHAFLGGSCNINIIIIIIIFIIIIIMILIIITTIMIKIFFLLKDLTVKNRSDL